MKTVLITGADGALGKHVMNRFASVSKAIGTRLPPSAGAEPELRENWLSVDLSSGRAMARAWELLGSAKSEPDIVVHCAGGFRYSPQEAISDADLEFLLSANLKSSLLLSRAAIPAMKAKSYGRLVFVGARGALGRRAEHGRLCGDEGRRAFARPVARGGAQGNGHHGQCRVCPR